MLTIPASSCGPASAYGWASARCRAAYIRNDQRAGGGINGRKINLIQDDDAYSFAEDGRAGGASLTPSFRAATVSLI